MGAQRVFQSDIAPSRHGSGVNGASQTQDPCSQPGPLCSGRSQEGGDRRQDVRPECSSHLGDPAPHIQTLTPQASQGTACRDQPRLGLSSHPTQPPPMVSTWARSSTSRVPPLGNAAECSRSGCCELQQQLLPRHPAAGPSLVIRAPSPAKGRMPATESLSASPHFPVAWLCCPTRLQQAEIPSVQGHPSATGVL